MLFSLDFASNAISLCFFIFFLIIHFYFLIITQVFNPIVVLVVPTGITTKQAKTETETNPVIIKAKIRKCSI